MLESHFDTFHDLEPQKKERIINAALDEFTLKGFRKASTNTIVEKAGISKGMLFYYFSSKEELFDFLCNYTIEFAKREYVEKFEHNAQTYDFIERYKTLIEVKKSAFSVHPQIIKFYESFYFPENTDYFNKYNDVITEFSSHVREKLYNDIDYSLFRDDIEPEKIVIYIRWLMERYEEELADKLKQSALNSDLSEQEGVITGMNVEEEFDRFYAFLADLRKAFYK